MSGRDKQAVQADVVSVIIAVYNGAATIIEAVQSVLAQSWRKFELIVVDDGSTDATRDVLRIVVDERLQVISQPRSGQAAARNRGIEHARGEYFAFIDADDVWLPEKLAAQLAAFRRTPDAAVAYCWIDYITAEGYFVCPDSRPRFDGYVLAQLLTRNFIDCSSSTVVRRQALLDVGGFDESLRLIEDWDLNIRLAARHEFVCVPQALVHYRQSPTTLSTQVMLMEKAYWQVSGRAFAQAPRSLQHLRSKSAANFYEYLTGKATQGIPTRASGVAALDFFGTAVRSRPAILLDLWRRPWVVKSVAKALFSIVLPAAAMQKLAELWPWGIKRTHAGGGA